MPRIYVGLGQKDTHDLLKSYVYEFIHEETHFLDPISCHYVVRHKETHFLPLEVEANVNGFEVHLYTQLLDV